MCVDDGARAWDECGMAWIFDLLVEFVIVPTSLYLLRKYGSTGVLLYLKYLHHRNVHQQQLNQYLTASKLSATFLPPSPSPLPFTLVGK